MGAVAEDNKEENIVVVPNEADKHPIADITINGFDSSASPGQTLNLVVTLKNMGTEASSGGSGIHLRFKNAKIIGVSGSTFVGSLVLAEWDGSSTISGVSRITYEDGTSNWNDQYSRFNLMELYGEVSSSDSETVTVTIKVTDANPIVYYRGWLGDPTDWVWVDAYGEYQTRWYRDPGDNNYMYMDPIQYPTHSLGGIPPTSPQITSSGLSGTDVSLSWSSSTDSDGYVKHYLIQESTESDFSIITGEWTRTGTSVVLTNRGIVGKVATLYYRVLAVDNNDLISVPSDVVSFIIDRSNEAEYTAPQIITSNQTINHREIWVTWTNSKHVGDGTDYYGKYELEHVKPDGTTITQIIDGRSYSYTNAEDGTHLIRVRVVNGRSPWSNMLNVTVYIPPPPSKVLIVDKVIVLYHSVIGNPNYKILSVSVGEVHREGSTTFVTSAVEAFFTIFSTDHVPLLNGTLQYYQRDFDGIRRQWIGFIEDSNLSSVLQQGQRYYIRAYLDDGYARGWSKVPTSNINAYFCYKCPDVGIGSDFTGTGTDVTNVGDVDGDGLLERLVPSYSRIDIYHLDGRSLVGWPVKAADYGRNAFGELASKAYLEDLDNDGSLEIIIRYETSVMQDDGTLLLQTFIWAFSHDGKLVDGFPYVINNTRAAQIPTLTFYDIDGDGKREILFSIAMNDYSAVVALNEDASLVSNFPVQLSEAISFNTGGYIFIADFDDDAELEIVATTAYHVFTVSFNGLVKDVFSATNNNNIGNIISTSIYPPIMTNLAGDDRLELLIPLGQGFLIFHPGPNWKDQLTYYIYPSSSYYQFAATIVAVGNFDEDQYDELIVIGDSYPQYITDYGQLTMVQYLYKVDVPLTYGNMSSLPNLSPFFSARGAYTLHLLPYDIDDDGIDELMVSGQGIVDYHGNVTMFGELNVNYFSSSTIITDVDGDGGVDLVGATVVRTNMTFHPNRLSTYPLQSWSYHDPIDIKAPMISWKGQNEVGARYTVQAFLWDVDYQTLSHVQLLLNGNKIEDLSIEGMHDYLFKYTLNLTRGTHVIQLKLFDSAGNVRVATRTVQVDLLGPRVISSNLPLSPTIINTTQDTLTFQIRVSDSSGNLLEFVQLTVDNETTFVAINNSGNPVLIETTVTLKRLGRQTVIFRIADVADNFVLLVYDVWYRTTPSTPQNFQGEARDKEILLTWEMPSIDGGDLTSLRYLIYRKDLNDTNNSSDFVLLDTTTALYYLDTTAVNTHTYQYYIVAENSIGRSNASVIIELTPVGTPYAPEFVTISQNESVVTLQWSTPSNDGGATIIGYVIYRRELKIGGLEFIANTTSLNFTDTLPKKGVYYYYYIVAINSHGLGQFSEEKVAIIPWKPFPPLNFMVTPRDGEVLLEWEAPLSDGGAALIHYRIYRSRDPNGTFINIANVTSLNYTDSSVINDNLYYYYMTAVNTLGESNATRIIAAAPGSRPTAPQNLSGSINNNATISLSWEAPIDQGSAPISGYRVYRSDNSNDAFRLVGETDAATLTFTDTNVNIGVTYYYIVSAFNLYGESAFSNEITILLAFRSVPPRNLSVTMQNGAVILSWLPPIDDGGAPITEYRLYRSTTSGTSYVFIGSTTSTSYTDTSELNTGVTYYYVVTAVNAMGESDFSNEGTITFQNPTPTTTTTTPPTTSTQPPLPTTSAPSNSSVGTSSEIVSSSSAASSSGNFQKTPGLTILAVLFSLLIYIFIKKQRKRSYKNKK